MSFTYLKTQPKKKLSKTFEIDGVKYAIDAVALYKPLSCFSGIDFSGLKAHEGNAKLLKEAFESITCNGANVLESDESANSFCNELNCAFSYLFDKVKEFSLNGKVGN